jgi:hypothetical protein
MDETPREIEAHIDRTRERLGSHLVELEHKVEAATDWREHFRARPRVFLGAAFVGGATLAVALHARSQRSVSDEADDAGIRRFVDDPSSARAQVLELWNNLKGALIGVASTRVMDYLGELLPGFDEHYRRAEERTLAPSPASSVRR